jgi:cation diffusion facilitator CzcD-associated flavoprotein CzcO/acetyl esterase/lipase
MATPPPRILLPEGALRASFQALSALIDKRSFAFQRRVTDYALIGLPLAPGTRAERATVGGVAGRRIRLDHGSRAGALLYLHGGGYVVGSSRSELSCASYLAAGISVEAFLPDYRKGPDHQHPAGLDDALAAYRGLLDEGVPEGRIVVAGESAGGGLALALAMGLRDEKLPAPALVGLLSPWLDLSPEAVAAVDARADRDPLLNSALLERWAQAYAGSADRSDPLLSPLHGSFEDLPPIVLNSGTDDPLSAQADELARRARITHRRHAGQAHAFQVGAAVTAAGHAAIEEVAAAGREALAPVVSPRVVVVGAGMSGIGMGAALKRAGLEDFTIYEKAADLGGTWRANTYPGLTCDVPGRYYAYSFRPNPDWTATFAGGAELKQYFADCAAEFGLHPHFAFSTGVEEARWQGGRWQLTLSEGRTDVADVVVCATGILRIPRTPEIPGLDTFAGAAFHSAEWDHSVPVDGRRVAVVGAGSTGVQIVSALAGRAAKVVAIQRSPQWVLPVLGWEHPRWSRALRRRFPVLDRLSYRSWRAALEATFGTATVQPGFARWYMTMVCRVYRRLALRDSELRAKLTPKDQPLCKRIVMSTKYYSAVQQPTVELVTEDVERVEPAGIVTRDGRLHEVDVIVLATGFHTSRYMQPMRVVGPGGPTLDDAWSPDPRAYLNVALPGFPNFFMLLGPHSPIGNHSLTAITESQGNYIMRLVELIRAGVVKTVSPTAEATARFNREMREAMPNTIWTSGCDSWYLDSEGNPDLFPWTPQRHRELLAEPSLAEFELT